MNNKKSTSELNIIKNEKDYNYFLKIVTILNDNNLSFKKLRDILQEYLISKKLERYRDGLAIWEEYTRDTKDRVIVTLDGRDTAGKGSNIKRVTYDLPNPRFTVKAFGKPSIIDKFEYNHFLKYMKYFPDEKGGITFFDRSWYNRSGVEAAMGFCTEEEYNWFIENVNKFESEQVVNNQVQYIDDDGNEKISEKIKLLKVYLSINKGTQSERLDLRKKRVRKRHKISPIDQKAQEKWNAYTLAKARTLELTDSIDAPWKVIDSNEKWFSAIEIIKAIINTSEEVSKIVGAKLDLTPNTNVVRTAKQEIERMKIAGDFDKMDKEFDFHVYSESDLAKIQAYRDTHYFDEEKYVYVQK